MFGGHLGQLRDMASRETRLCELVLPEYAADTGRWPQESSW